MECCRVNLSLPLIWLPPPAPTQNLDLLVPALVVPPSPCSACPLSLLFLFVCFCVFTQLESPSCNGRPQGDSIEDLLIMDPQQDFLYFLHVTSPQSEHSPQTYLYHHTNACTNSNHILCLHTGVSWPQCMMLHLGVLAIWWSFALSNVRAFHKNHNNSRVDPSRLRERKHARGHRNASKLAHLCGGIWSCWLLYCGAFVADSQGEGILVVAPFFGVVVSCSPVVLLLSPVVVVVVVVACCLFCSRFSCFCGCCVMLFLLMSSWTGTGKYWVFGCSFLAC